MTRVKKRTANLRRSEYDCTDGNPSKGETQACGVDPQTGSLRYTFGSLYLWDRLDLIPVVVGLIALTIFTVAYSTIKKRMGKAKYERPEDAV